MNQTDFDRNARMILAEVVSIMADRDTRKQRRVAAVRTHQGETVAEVIDTSQGPVVVYRSDAGELNPEDDSYRPWRQDRAKVVEPLTGDPEQTFDIMSEAGELYLLKARDFDTRTFSFMGHADSLRFV